jgi:hypothetical protein
MTQVAQFLFVCVSSIREYPSLAFCSDMRGLPLSLDARLARATHENLIVLLDN